MLINDIGRRLPLQLQCSYPGQQGDVSQSIQVYILFFFPSPAPLKTLQSPPVPPASHRKTRSARVINTIRHMMSSLSFRATHEEAGFTSYDLQSWPNSIPLPFSLLSSSLTSIKLDLSFQQALIYSTYPTSIHPLPGPCPLQVIRLLPRDMHNILGQNNRHISTPQKRVVTSPHHRWTDIILLTLLQSTLKRSHRRHVS